MASLGSMIREVRSAAVLDGVARCAEYVRERRERFPYVEADAHYFGASAREVAWRLGVKGARQLGNGAKGKRSWSGTMNPALRVAPVLRGLAKQGLLAETPGYKATVSGDLYGPSRFRLTASGLDRLEWASAVLASRSGAVIVAEWVKAPDRYRETAEDFRERVAAALAVPRERCPDDGKCHHRCTAGEACYRVKACAPLSVTGWDEWPEDVRSAEVAGW